MSDIREMLAKSLAHSRRGVCARVSEGDRAQADDLLAVYLVVPRAEITGIEYGWRDLADPSRTVTCDGATRDWAVGAAQAAERNSDVGRRAEPVERPAMPWSTIETAGTDSPITDAEYGCGYEWDHTIRPGTAECQECGAEIFDDEDGDADA